MASHQPRANHSFQQQTREDQPALSARGGGFYTGQGAGKQLHQEIEGAKSSVKIVSPYLSVEYLKILTSLQANDVAVTLISSTDALKAMSRENQRAILRTLIHQDTKVDEKAARRRHGRVGGMMAIAVVIVIFAFAFFASAATDAAVPAEYEDLMWLVALGAALVVGLLVLLVGAPLATNVKTHSYDYRPTLSRLRILEAYSNQGKTAGGNSSARADEPTATTLHAKLYVIDERLAYLGSLNFTRSGFYYNYECVVGARREDAVRRVSDDIEKLFYDRELKSLDDFRELGQLVYSEPPNDGAGFFKLLGRAF